MEAFPDTPLVKRILFKEQAVLAAMRERYPDFHIVHNRQVSACSKKRPDILIDLGSMVLIVEEFPRDIRSGV